MNLYGVTGYKNSGKTGLMERLVTEITKRGLTVSTIKHAHHATDVDHEGRDSFRHRQAGAGQVLVSSPLRWALMTELRGADEPSLEDLLSRLDPVDLILIEGFKTAPHPKIEAHRLETGSPLLAATNSTIRAVASNSNPQVSCPLFHLDDTSTIADFILSEVGL